MPLQIKLPSEQDLRWALAAEAERQKGKRGKREEVVSLSTFWAPLLLFKADEHVRALEVDDDDGGVSLKRQMSHMRFWQMEMRGGKRAENVLPSQSKLSRFQIYKLTWCFSR